MVHQRSVSYDEVDTEWILLLDDDVYLPPDAMEKLFLGLEIDKADFISPDTFHNHAQSKIKKLKAMATFVFPRRNDKWAFKLMRNTSFTYNNRPDKSRCYLTQSAAGPCMLVRKRALQSIHLQDEQWMDALGYPLYEDMALVRKLSLGGYKCLVHYDSGVVHLDAGTSHAKDPDKQYLLSRTVTYVLWYRVFYNLKYSTVMDRILALLSYFCLQCWQFCFNTIPRTLKYHSFRSIWLFFKTFADGNRIIRSETFRKIPYYDEYAKVRS